MSEFSLHPQLRTDSLRVGQLKLCELRLLNDERFQWCILIPRIADLVELHDLPTAHRLALFDEIEQVSVSLIKHSAADKINVAALGNRVEQLHVHVIGRKTTDPAWPNSVWTAGPADAYTKSGAEATIRSLREQLRIS